MLTDAMTLISDLKECAREEMRRENLARLDRYRRRQDQFAAALSAAALAQTPEVLREYLALPDGELGQEAWVAAEVPGHHAVECLFRMVAGAYQLVDWPVPDGCIWVEGEPVTHARWRCVKPDEGTYCTGSLGAILCVAEVEEGCL